jgi:hypothetical protein
MAERLVKVVNNTNADLEIQLHSGTSLSMTQFRQGKTTHMSKVIDFSDLPDSVTKKKFDLYKDGDFYTDKTLFSSGSGTSLSQAVDNAQKDMEEKMKFLGKKGNQKIYTFEQSHTYHAVIITEILDKRIKNPMYDRESGIYR